MLKDPNTPNWFNVQNHYEDCPRCKNGKLDTRVKRSFIVKYIFIWMNVKRYQCNTCERKFYIKNTCKNHQFNLNSNS